MRKDGIDEDSEDPNETAMADAVIRALGKCKEIIGKEAEAVDGPIDQSGVVIVTVCHLMKDIIEAATATIVNTGSIDPAKQVAKMVRMTVVPALKEMEAKVVGRENK